MGLLTLTWRFSGGFCALSNHFADSAIQERDFESANSWLSRSVWLSPSNAEATFLAARIARLQNDNIAMNRLLDLAGSYGLKADRVLLERQLSRAQSGFLSEVEVAITERLSKADHDLSEICEAYANGLAKESRFEAALEVLKAWKTDEPHTPIPFYRIARIEEYLQKTEQAKVNYRIAIEKNRLFYPALFSLARLYLDENEATESLSLFERCLTMPKPVAAKIGMAMSHSKLGNSDKAKTILIEACTKGSAEAWLSYSSVGETYERFIAASELGKILASEGEYERAIEYLDLALDENPRDLSARYSKGLALQGLKRESDAEIEFRSVAETKNALQRVNSLRNQINRSSEDVESRLELGKLLIKYESERSGLFWLRSALGPGENNPNVHEALAEYYESHLKSEPDNERLARLHRERFHQLEKSPVSMTGVEPPSP